MSPYPRDSETADLTSRLSPVLWDLLQRTRLRAEPALELFDAALTPLCPASDDPRIVAVRSAASIRFFAGSELSFHTVLQKGREARLAVDPWQVFLLPIRDDAKPIALLAVVSRRESTAEWAATPDESVARAWRDLIEGDLASTRRLRAQEQLANRSRAVASFVADLQQFSDERGLLEAMLQAIAVWHDVEPCVYSRDLAGKFRLRCALPGADASALPASLDVGAALESNDEPSDDWPILRQVAWEGRATPLLILVRSGSLEDWVLALTGSHEPEIVKQLRPMLRGFATGLERVREREAGHLRQRLWHAIADWSDSADLPGLGRSLLRIICTAVDATDGLLTVTGEPSSAGAESGHPKTFSQGAHDGRFTADVLSMRFPVPRLGTAFLELRRTDGSAFRASNVTTVLAARPLLGTWLLGLHDTGAWHASFAVHDQPQVPRSADSSTAVS